MAVVLSVCFSGVSNALFSSANKYSARKFVIDNTAIVNYRVYVCGAVKNAGFYTFEAGDTYGDVLLKAGILDFSLIADFDALIPLDTDEIICYFWEDATEVYPVNVNSKLFSVIYETANIDKSVADKIISYIEKVGRINFVGELLIDGVLTEEEWNNTFFRIYVDLDGR